MDDLQALLMHQKTKLIKAVQHLDYSYKKIIYLKTDPNVLDEEELAIWESFASRFARVAELFISRYLKTAIKIEDPGFSGTVRDILNFAEKLNLINNASDWLVIRELRNITAHEYSDKDISVFFNKIRDLCPLLLNLKGL